MKKLFKRASLILLTVCTVFACAFALSACNGGNNYTFLIEYDDGTACTEVYALQICTENSCYPISGITPDSNGKVTLSQSKVDQICSPETDVKVFSFHVLYETTDDIKDYEVKVNGVNEYTITILK